jgi:hypothetical protein
VLDSKEDLSITLRAEEWNIVLEVLFDGRHRIVAPVIQKIFQQAQSAKAAEEAQHRQLKPVS